jgi:hypothetical protein
MARNLQLEGLVMLYQHREFHLSPFARLKLIGSAFIVVPIIVFFCVIALVRNPVTMSYVLWLMQFLICVSIPLGFGIIGFVWASQKKKPLLANYIKISSYVVAAVLTFSLIVPGLMRLFNEKIASLNPPSEQHMSELVATHYSKMMPGSYVKKIHSIQPNNTNWQVDADICLYKDSEAICVPMLTAFDSNYKVNSSEFNTERARQSIKDKLEQKK